MKNDKLVIERIYDASPEKIWEALTDLAQMKKWYFPELKEFKPKPGFSTEFNVHHDGHDYLHMWKVTEAIPLKKIAYEWKYKGYPGNSLLSLELEPVGNSTKLTLTHDRLQSFDPENHPTLSKEGFKEGWTHFVGALEEFLK